MGENAFAHDRSIDVSVVCPFYNEEQIVEEAVTRLLARLREMDISWELIVVNDGSLDGSAAVVERLLTQDERLRLVSYDVNRGRGHALRTGIARARGDIVVTTEIDLSWGEDIVERLYAAMQEHPKCDIIVASPHMDGGGYFVKCQGPVMGFLGRYQAYEGEER